jgi:hypothetical protein
LYARVLAISLAGKIFGGQAIEGSDPLRTVGCQLWFSCGAVVGCLPKQLIHRHPPPRPRGFCIRNVAAPEDHRVVWIARLVGFNHIGAQ